MWDTFCARPAEVATRGGGGPGGGRGAGGPETPEMRRIYDLIGVHPIGGRGGFGGRGGGAGLVGTGDYLVTMTADGQTYRQVLHVERSSGSSSEIGPLGGGDNREP